MKSNDVDASSLEQHVGEYEGDVVEAAESLIRCAVESGQEQAPQEPFSSEKASLSGQTRWSCFFEVVDHLVERRAVLTAFIAEERKKRHPPVVKELGELLTTREKADSAWGSLEKMCESHKGAASFFNWVANPPNNEPCQGHTVKSRVEKALRVASPLEHAVIKKVWDGYRNKPHFVVFSPKLLALGLCAEALLLTEAELTALFPALWSGDVHSDFERYKKLSYNELCDEQDVLSFWKKQTSTFPCLSPVAICLIRAVCTVTGVDGVFSSLDAFMSKRRASLGTNALCDKLLCYRCRDLTGRMSEWDDEGLLSVSIPRIKEEEENNEDEEEECGECDELCFTMI